MGIEGSQAAKRAAWPPPSPVDGRLDTWRSLLAFTAFSALFWAAEYAGQYFWLAAGDPQAALDRSFALTGATFIGVSLALSAVFKWRPKLSFYWRVRRRFGVAGFVFISMHVLSALAFVFRFDLGLALYSLDPIRDPVIFGAVAYPIFLVMALTSFDRAVNALSVKRWKQLHRTVYVAQWAATFHFMTIAPDLLREPPGFLLIAVTAFALAGQLYWYVRIAGKRRFMTAGGVYGLVIILLYLAGLYLVLRP